MGWAGSSGGWLHLMEQRRPLLDSFQPTPPINPAEHSLGALLPEPLLTPECSWAHRQRGQ